ncbi:MAG: protein kinase [Thermoanaerobaculia bacterium]
MPLLAGSRLGQYEILAPLGAGGMGEVYRARDTKLDREVAIKVLPPDMAEDVAALARFEREAKAVAALSHPNILAIHDFGSSNGVTYAAMELLSGETLRQRLDHGALPVRRAVEIAREIALGLAAAHEKGVVHRDLKPSNLFLSRDGLVKILDFGLARQARPAAQEATLSDRTEPGKIVGTAGYMSPEQVRGKLADQRSDIFSFGAVFYEMLTGKRAFKGDTSVETMNAILRAEPPTLSGSGGLVPPAVESVVAHCLEKQPGERFQSARDLAFALRSLSGSSASGAAPPIPARNSWSRHATLAAAVVAAAALGLWAGDQYGRGQRKTGVPAFRRLTFRRGNLLSARFAPDGKTVVYSAAWEGKPAELFSVRTDSGESRPLDIARADIASISSKGNLAILLKAVGLFSANTQGTLARLPIGSGAPRELLEDAFGASWAPNGEDLAVLRQLPDGKYRLEYPIGHPLYDSPFLRGPIGVSPDGELVAVMEPEGDNDGRRTLWAIDRRGEKHALATFDQMPPGLAWSPDSREVFFVGGKTSENLALRAVDLSGRERVLLPFVGSGLRLHDLAADGRFLLEHSSRRRGLVCRPAGDTHEHEIAWLDGSEIRGLSNDGRTILFREGGDGGRGPAGGVFLRRCDGSPAVRLGDGEPEDISPDGKWVLAMVGSEREIVILATGPGSSRKVAAAGIKPIWVQFTPNGKSIAIVHTGENGQFHLSVLNLEDGRLRKVPTPEITSRGLAFSPDGARVAYVTKELKLVSVPLSSEGAPRELPGPPIESREGVFQWSADGKFLYLVWASGVPARVSRREIATGKTSPWLELQPADVAGVTGVAPIEVTPDGGYAYSYLRTQSSDLYVAEGLK